MAPGPDAAWLRVLDGMERSLSDQRAALAMGGAVVVGPFQPPADLGPLPPALGPRVVDLLEQTRALEAALTSQRQEIGAQLSAVRRQRQLNHAPGGNGSPARFIDHSA